MTQRDRMGREVGGGLYVLIIKRKKNVFNK